VLLLVRAHIHAHLLPLLVISSSFCSMRPPANLTMRAYVQIDKVDQRRMSEDWAIRVFFGTAYIWATFDLPNPDRPSLINGSNCLNIRVFFLGHCWASRGATGLFNVLEGPRLFNVFLFLKWIQLNSNIILGLQMNSNEKVDNIKVVEIIEIYNFYFGHFSARFFLDNSNFEFQNMTTSNIIFR
jgi:hypothetical protein